MFEESDSDEIRSTSGSGRRVLFETRSLVAEAVSGGKVEINGDRPKPSCVVRAGDKLTIRRGPSEWTIVVTDISRLRGPAARAQQLYEETEESLRKREAAMAQLRLDRPPDLNSPAARRKRSAVRLRGSPSEAGETLNLFV